MVNMVCGSLGSIIFLALGLRTAGLFAPCLDITAITNRECFRAILWAKKTGIEKFPQWYGDFRIFSNSSNLDWQMVLWQKGQQIPSGTARNDSYPSRDHNCPCPCTNSLGLRCILSQVVTTPKPPVTTVVSSTIVSPTTTERISSSFPATAPSTDTIQGIFAPVVVGSICCLCLFACAYSIYTDSARGKPNTPKRKKRAFQSTRDESEPDEEEKMQPTAETLEPVACHRPLVDMTQYSTVQPPSPMPVVAPVPMYRQANPAMSSALTMTTATPLRYNQQNSPTGSLVPCAVPTYATAAPVADAMHYRH